MIKTPIMKPADLHKFLRFDFESGRMWWLEREGDNRFNKRYGGREALTGLSDGYPSGDINGERFLAHRVIYAAFYGKWPNYIDHINRDRTDNRISNLRSVTRAENQRNLPISRKNTSGYPGVSYRADWKKWRARIGDGKSMHLGLFDSFEQAVAARKEAEARLGYIGY